MVRKVLSHSNNVWFKSSRECMIFKIDENLGWNDKENDYTGKPSTINVKILNHNKENFLLFFVITDGIVINEETNCFYCDCCKNVSKKVLIRIKQYILDYNKKYKTSINKIIINDKFYSKKRIKYDF